MHSKRLLIIGLRWPEPEATAAGNRMLQLIRFFAEGGYGITIASTARPLRDDLARTVPGTRIRAIKLNDPSFDLFLGELDPQLVLFDRFITEEQFGWRVAERAPQALRILDTEDLHSLRHARQQALGAKVPFRPEQWAGEDITKRELASIYRSDISLIISPYEMELLRKVAGIPAALLCYLPFMVPKITEPMARSWPTFGQRRHFLFIGTGRHAPNIDCIDYLANQLWPGIRKALPEAELHLYGSYLPHRLKRLEGTVEGLLVKGRTDDVAKTMGRYRLQLAPLRFGAGIKGKLLDGMQFGTPGITTSLGAEGMRGTLPWNGSIADGPDRFIEAAIHKYGDAALWESAQEHGATLVNELFAKSHWHPLLRRRIAGLLRNRDARRSKNIVGGILWHHSLASTKYLAKWIEEKERGSRASP